MSTHYCPLTAITASDLFDGRLSVYGIVTKQTEDGGRCLFDSLNTVHVFIDASTNHVTSLSRYAGNNAVYIISAIMEAFSVRIVSEYEPEYWGFDTQAEWDAWQADMA